MTDRPAPALALTGVTKTFAGQRALDGVDLELRRGEIHALLGQNGSGKSTLIKVLAGYHRPDADAAAGAAVHGRELQLGSPHATRDAGIRFIHQDLGLIAGLDVVDNLALGAAYESGWWISDRGERAAARRLLAGYGTDIDVDAPVGSLRPSAQTIVAIVRALRGGMDGRGILVLDEPTVALPAEETEQLFAVLRGLRERGNTILYVTHRLSEIFAIADRVTILRDGRRVRTGAVAGFDHDSLVEAIVGRHLEASAPQAVAVAVEPVLTVEGLRGGAVEDLSMIVRRGEVVGVTGLVGSGFEDLPYLLFGARASSAGAVAVEGRPVLPLTPRTAIARGLAFAPADRRRLSAMPAWTLRENVTLPKLPRSPFARWMSPRAEARDAAPWLERLGVVPRGPETVFSSLSGGNQQRVVLARWLRCGASAFVLEEPTNGVDVAAKRAIYDALAGAAAGGAAILLTSSDGEELCAVCDRVVVLREGRIATTLTDERRTPEAVLAASTASTTTTPRTGSRPRSAAT
jgi:ribose transport system ATP-binding protein